MFLPSNNLLLQEKWGYWGTFSTFPCASGFIYLKSLCYWAVFGFSNDQQCWNLCELYWKNCTAWELYFFNAMGHSFLKWKKSNPCGKLSACLFWSHCILSLLFNISLPVYKQIQEKYLFSVFQFSLMSF